MGIFNKLFGQGTSEIINSIGNAIDSTVTSDEERLKLKAEIEKIQGNVAIKSKMLDNKYEENLTERLRIDNESRITRLVRPLSFVFILVVFVAVMFLDGNYKDFNIKATYLELIEVFVASMIMFYFGGRSLEKISKIRRG